MAYSVSYSNTTSLRISSNSSLITGRFTFFLNASAMLGSGSTWVHCVRMGDAAAAANQDARRTPVMLCNDDTMGWAEGLRRLTLAGAQRVDKRPRRIRH